MKRFLLPGVLALTLHGALFSLRSDWQPPVLTGPRLLALTLTRPEPKKPAPPPAPQLESPPQVESPPPLPRPEPPPPDPEPEIAAPAEEPAPPAKPAAKRIAQRARPAVTPRPQPTTRLPSDSAAVQTTAPSPARETVAFPEKPARASPPAPTPAQAPAPDTPPAEMETALVMPAYRLSRPPAYPILARRRGYEGTVLLEVLVETDGRVADLRLLQSSGHPMLDQAARDGVGQWLFEPGRRGGEKTALWVRVPVRFQLH